MVIIGAGYDKEQLKILNKYFNHPSVKVLPRVTNQEMHNYFAKATVFLLFSLEALHHLIVPLQKSLQEGM